MHVDIKDDGENVLLEITLTHIKGTRNSKQEFGPAEAYQVLVDSGHDVKKTPVVGGTIYNYRTKRHLKGSWVFKKNRKKKPVVEPKAEAPKKPKKKEKTSSVRGDA